MYPIFGVEISNGWGGRKVCCTLRADGTKKYAGRLSGGGFIVTRPPLSDR